MSDLLKKLDTAVQQTGQLCRTCTYISDPASDPEVVEFLVAFAKRKREGSTQLTFDEAARMVRERGFRITEGAIRNHVRQGHD